MFVGFASEYVNNVKDLNAYFPFRILCKYSAMFVVVIPFYMAVLHKKCHITQQWTFVLSLLVYDTQGKCSGTYRLT